VLSEATVDAALVKLRDERVVVNVSRRDPLLLVGGWSERRADGLFFYEEGGTWFSREGKCLDVREIK
jgi:hypothetical protein